jgi:hypothetical protein
MIIITQMKMTNRLVEPDSWAVIDTLDSEQEIHDQQRFLLLAAVALSFWNHPMDETQSQCNQQNVSINSDSKPVQSAKCEHQMTSLE